MDGRELTFDEFRSQHARSKAGPATTAPATLKSDKKKTTGLGMGAFLEMNEMQAFYLFVLVTDLASEFMNVALELEMGEMDAEDPMMTSLTTVQATLVSFITFSRFFFAAEIAALVLIFRFKVVGHFGYLMDIIIIGLQLRAGVTGGARDVGVSGKVLAALSYLRLWRAYRFFSGIITAERREHDATRSRLEDTDEALARFKVELAAKEEDLDKEKEARDLVELMLQDYKEKVDELNEALIIASKEILEVGRADDLEFDSEDDDVADYESLLDEHSKASGGHTHSLTSGSVGSARPNI